MLCPMTKKLSGARERVMATMFRNNEVVRIAAGGCPNTGCVVTQKLQERNEIVGIALAKTYIEAISAMTKA